MLTDLRYALRTLFRSPGFTAVAVIVLALGIGANTAVFSVINAVLLRPLPYPQPDQLLILRESTSLFDSGSVSLPNYLDWRAAQKTCQDLAIARPNNFNLSVPQAGSGNPPERLRCAEVSANLLDVLRCPPALGRCFTPAEDVPGGPKVTLISDALWRRKFNADPAVIGQRVVLDAEAYEIIGVMSPDTGFPRQANLIVPLGDARGRPGTNNRGNHPACSVLARTRDGVSVDTAREDFNTIARGLAKQYPDTNTDRGINVRPMLENSVGEYRGKLYLLLGAVGCVLLIACANVANLQLARATGRTKELAVRAALGASRWRLMRQMLVESALLGLLGGIGAVLLALWATDAIVSLSPANVPRFHDVHVDWVALGFTAAVAVGAGLLVGVWPAWRLSSMASMSAALHESAARGASGGSGRVRVRSLLVVAQVALALVLLAGAGLALRGFWGLRGRPLGFDPEGVLTVMISLPDKRYPDAARIGQFYTSLLERVRAIPGVVAAATGVNTPFDSNEWDSNVHITGTPPNVPGQEPSAEMNFVTPDYFTVLGMPILRGRAFDGRETFGAPRSVIVDESFVRRFFPDRDPIGQHVDDNQVNDKNPPPLTIVGVVPRTLNDGPEETVYLDKMSQMHLCVLQTEESDQRLLVRVDGGDPVRIVEAVRQAVQSLDVDLPISEVATMKQNIAASLAPQRLTMVLLGTFAALALCLATVGLYGVMALSVTQRTRELGIRLALGAQRGAVLALVLRQGATLVAIGLGVGLLAALLLGRVLARVLYGVGGNDVLTLAGVSLLLAGAALFACWVPARRAVKLDPMVALRSE